jgi:hypothetical protein
VCPLQHSCLVSQVERSVLLTVLRGFDYSMDTGAGDSYTFNFHPEAAGQRCGGDVLWPPLHFC